MAVVWPVFQVYPPVHQIWPTILVVVGSLVVVTPFTEPKYYAKSDWQPAATDGGPNDLDGDELLVLTFVATGASRYSDLIEALGVDGTQVNDVVETLEREGLVRRRGYRGRGMFDLALTDAGNRALAEHDPADLVEVDGEYVTATALDVLELLGESESGHDTGEIAEELGLRTTEVTAHLRVLERKGYLTTSGVLFANYRLSGAGESGYKRFVGATRQEAGVTAE
ncbi:hypothetical protein BRC81_17245 [Halobacteriales archaeon QS_1_68_20]|nr:MAG: hypothetical protein BRC81_17245 [Halobacteriales archaeon QS_1_68_20]